ncbi:MAG: SEC-C domain-containing protein, partial [Clostridia bacterium]|nr:SEC-C domain-containing protein [Clostridia bacterium]
VDEFTGRIMYGRRFNEGLHQAIEAKENVKIEKESRTLATITFQNYFRLYEKLSGMTGTALTEEDEFDQIYGMDVIAIPTNRPMIRIDENDSIYKNEIAKLNAVVEDVVQSHAKGQPVLVGTISVEKSEQLSAMLRRRGVEHNVLNAKFHDREAEIVAQAGRYGAVTIATNMAGRGTDILLGGNPEFLTKQQLRQDGFGEHAVAEANAYGKTEDMEVLTARARYAELYAENEKITNAEKERVVAAGGLYIIGTERHESRRIDNQLRGRSGRQGDPGKSRFYISLGDDLMRLFGGERTYALVERFGLPEDMPIEAGMLSNAIESAQKRVEGRNFDIRKSVLQYDDVMNQQRTIIYEQRDRILSGADIHQQYVKIMAALVDQMVHTFCSESANSSEWDWNGIDSYLGNIFFDGEELEALGLDRDNISREKFRSRIQEAVADKYAAREQEFGAETIRQLERLVMLRHVNQRWMAHIDAMADLKNGIGLRAIGQRDPVQEYKFEGFNMFDEMNRCIREDSVKVMMRGRMVLSQQPQTVQRPMDLKAVKEESESVLRRDMNQFEKAGTAMGKSAPVKQPKVNDAKVGRNDPCPCGSGKKYKNCCGKNQ